jgi:hypothetical protein
MSNGKTAIYGRYVGFRAFIEGIEIDIIEGAVSGGINSPCTANLTIPFNDAAHKLCPRSLVHIFFMDSRYEVGAEAIKGSDDDPSVPPKVLHYNKAGVGEAQTTDAKKLTQTAAKLVDKNDPMNWKLLFVGELVGYKYQKIGAIRQIVLMCQDVTSYLQQAKLHWGRQNTSLNSYKQAIFSGATQLHRGKSRVDSSNDLAKLLSVKASTNPQVPGLLGGLIATLESVTGVFSPTAITKFRGASDFMSQAELRLHMTRMLGASEKDDTTATFISSRSFKRYLRKLTKAQKGTASYYDLMNVILSKCYQVWNSVPAPPYIDNGTIKVEWLQKISGFNYKNDPAVNPFFKEVDSVYMEIGKKITQGKRRRAKDGASTSPNTTDASKSISLSSDFIRTKRDGAKEAVDTGTHKGVESTVSPKLGKTSRWKSAGQIRDAGTAVYQGAIKKPPAQRKAARKVNEAYQLVADAKGQMDSLSKKSGDDFTEHTEETYYGIKSKLEKARALLAKSAGINYKRKESIEKVNPRLNCFLFHPDIFMCPPPKCNVLFPDHIQSITFSRGWMSEITRVWMHGRTESGRAKKNCYFSPNTSILSASDKLSETAVKKGHTFMMRHERLTGINSVIVGLGDNDIFKKIHVKGLAKAKKDARKKFKGDKSPEAKQKIEDEISMFTGPAQHSPQVHLQRAANYMFWVNRYSSRVIRVHARFCPQLVAGMPCLILDPMRGSKSRFVQDKTTQLFKANSNERVTEQGLSGITPGQVIKTTTPRGTHFVGTIANIQHTFSADGGANTLIQLVKCREHDEAHDVFKDTDNPKDGKFDTKRIKKKYFKRWIEPKPESHLSENGLSPSGSFQTGTTEQGNFEKDMAAVLGTQYKRGKKYTMEATKEKGSTKPIPTKLLYAVNPDGSKVGQSPTASSDFKWNAELGKWEGGGPNRDGLEVKVFEHGSSKVLKDVNFTFEAMATPPWFAEIFHAANIGAEYYQPLMGCQSVVDGSLIDLQSGEEWKKGTDLVEVFSGEGGEEEEVKHETIILPIATTDGKETREVMIPKSLMDPVITTSAAANALAELWLGLKEVGANANLFMDAYNDRAYATMLDILGNTNPDILIKTQDQESRSFSLGDVPFTGFHTWAVGNLTGLENLDGAAETYIKHDKRSSPRKVDASVDTRAEKYAAAKEYFVELKAGQYGHAKGKTS